MKLKTMIAVTTLVMNSSFALGAGEAQDPKAHHPQSADATNQQAPGESAGGMPMMKMHEQMRKVHSQMGEIHRTEDPAKRDQLIQSHMTDMQSMMKMMQNMQGDKPMMGGHQGGKGAASQEGEMANQPKDMAEMMNRQQMMEQRMNMMQMMMDQMLQNQAATEETRMIRDRRHDHSTTK